MPSVLFLAMSGVRVHNAALMARGLTLPGFVERSRVIASLPSLGLLTLAAHTPTHWEVAYQECDSDDLCLLAGHLAGSYDLIAISALTARIHEAYALADLLRAGGATVVLGGLHVSVLPREAAPHADAVVAGEGELLWPALLRDFEDGNLQPLYSSLGQRPGYTFRQARVPRYDLLDIERYNRLTLQTTRGCPLDCAFCAASRLISPYKLKPLPQVRAELEAILAIWPTPFIELADDNTFAHPAWARGLVELLGEYNVPWFTETDISVADNDDLLRALAAANCAQLLIGLESSSPRALLESDSRRWKQRQSRHYVEKIRKIQSHGIPVNGCFIIGFDSDDAGVFERSRDFIFESELAEVQITLLTPFPGTALHRSLHAAGRLLRPVFWEQCTLFDATFQPRHMKVDQLESGFADLMSEVYSDSATTARRRLFRGCRKQRRQHAQGAALPEATPA